MLYYKKKRSRKKHYYRIISIILVIILSSNIPQSIEASSKFAGILMTPINSLTSKTINLIEITIDSIFGTKSNRDAVNKLNLENEQLRKEINDLKYVISDKKFLEESYNLKKNNYGILANVIMTDNIDYFKKFSINKGSNDGIKKGDIVLASYNGAQKGTKGALVGLVEEVSINNSVVSSILDDTFNISFIHGNTSNVGIINNRNNENLEGYMLKESKIKIGDDVFTSGIGGRYNRGLYLGKINKIDKSLDKLQQIITVDSPIDFSRLYEVYVISGRE